MNEREYSDRVLALEEQSANRLLAYSVLNQERILERLKRIEKILVAMQARTERLHIRLHKYETGNRFSEESLRRDLEPD